MTSSSSGSPPISAQDTGYHAAAKKTSLTPINTALRRDDSSSSGEHVMMARHKTSVDRLRAQQPERVPSPASTNFHTPVPSEGDGSSRANSPHPSSLGYSGRQSGLSPGYPRPYSMTSISSSRQYMGPVGGAPHQGRPLQLEMPRLLGARPDHNGDFFWGTARPSEGFSLNTADSRGGHQRMSSGLSMENGRLAHYIQYRFADSIRPRCSAVFSTFS